MRNMRKGEKGRRMNAYRNYKKNQGLAKAREILDDNMLQKDIEERAGTISGVQGMDNYTQLQSDIKRLRRELMELSKMICSKW